MGLYGSYTVAEDVMSVVDSVTKQDVLKVFVFLSCLFVIVVYVIVWFHYCSLHKLC